MRQAESGRSAFTFNAAPATASANESTFQLVMRIFCFDVDIEINSFHNQASE